MAKILEFPKEKSVRVTRLNKTEAQKFFLTFSLFTFILLIVLSHESVLRSGRPVYVISDNSPEALATLNRAIASAQPFDLFQNVKAEHHLASELGQSRERGPAALSQKLTLLDQLRYGTLQGKYRIISGSEAGRDSSPVVIREIEYIDSAEITDRPVAISDMKSFLLEYEDLFPVEFQSAQLETPEDATAQKWNLIQKGETVGTAHLRLDEQGRLLAMKVEIQSN